MNSKKMVRTSVVVMAMGVGLLLARPASAQQDMDPTHFDDPTMAPISHPVNAIPAVQAANVATGDSVAPLQAKATDTTVLESATSPATLLLGLGPIVLIGTVAAIGGARRRREEEQGSSAAATAN